MCVAPKRKLALWRPDANSSAKIRIRSSDGKTQQLDWAAGKTSTVWPSALPISNSSEYQIEWPDTGDKSKVTFVSVPGTPTDLVGAAKVLIDNGCQHQLDLLVQSASK